MRIFSSGTRWRAFSGVLLIMFLLRALIPAGFMPAPASSQAGIPGLTYCISGLPGSAAQSPASRKPGADTEPQISHCIFSIATGQAAMLLAALMLAPAIFYLVRAVFTGTARNARAHIVRGPPLGSRAPPPRPA
ncbi:MAG TPA: hypothetical protein VNS29_09365 [Burkholderiaceae bacterium]|nr:hypothetical protein [Burkholderiaceae bacterium]